VTRAVEPVHARGEQRRADQRVDERQLVRDCREAVEFDEAARERSSVLVLPGHEHALGGYEDVVEQRRRLDHLALAGERVFRLALPLCREVRARDQRKPRCVEGNGERDCVRRVLLAHRACRQHDHLVRVDRDGRVDLRAPDDDPVVPGLDDAQVGVLVRLLRRRKRAVALEVGLSDADGEILVAAVLVERVDAPGMRFPELVLQREQGEQGIGADLLDQHDERLPCARRSLDQGAARKQVVAGAGDVEIAAVALAHDCEIPVVRVVGELVVERRVLDRVPEDVVRRHVADALAAVEHAASIAKALPVFVGGAKAPILLRHGHGALLVVR
jgi:hypothetical protein